MEPAAIMKTVDMFLVGINLHIVVHVKLKSKIDYDSEITFSSNNCRLLTGFFPLLSLQ